MNKVVQQKQQGPEIKTKFMRGGSLWFKVFVLNVSSELLAWDTVCGDSRTV